MEAIGRQEWEEEAHSLEGEQSDSERTPSGQKAANLQQRPSRLQVNPGGHSAVDEHRGETMQRGWNGS